MNAELDHYGVADWVRAGVRVLGHRQGGPAYEPGSFERLLASLEQTHEVRCLGPKAPGCTILALR